MRWTLQHALDKSQMRTKMEEKYQGAFRRHAEERT